MRTTLILLLSLYCPAIKGQVIELFGGLNVYSFYDLQRNEGHYRADYTPKVGYLAGIGYERNSGQWLDLRLTLHFDHFSGALKASDGGLGGGFTTKADVTKSVLSLGLYP